MGELYAFLPLLLMQLSSVYADHSVYILSKNLEQYITSTTLEWVPSDGYNESLLESAVIAAYQTVEEPRHNELGDEEAQDGSTDLVKKPVYVCRAMLNSVWVSGQLRPKKNVCVVSLYRKVSEYKKFEILVNIEGSSRLSWVHKNKYTLISQGAVAASDNPMKTFVARRSANSHDLEGSLTHIVGKFTLNENLGVFHLVDQNNDELPFEDGEILVETEPISYEFKSVKLDGLRGRFTRTPQTLGEAVLKNEEDGPQHVASVISYSYNYTLFWGKGHGLLTGLPFIVALPNRTRVKGQWAVVRNEERSEVAAAQQYLEPGTAVNVTLTGSYTESEVPYNATVVALYEDGEKREITIRDTKREHTMLDVGAVYGPVYFLHNNSHVPTTTTTTTTAATTRHTTSVPWKTTTQDAARIVSPEVITHKNVDDKYSRPQDSTNMLSDQHAERQDPSTKKPEPDAASSLDMFSLVTISLVSLVLLRVT